MITSSVAKITFVVAEIPFKVIVITSSFILNKVTMSEKSCWLSLKNVRYCSNGGIKYKLCPLVYIFKRNNILCIASKFLIA